MCGSAEVRKCGSAALIVPFDVVWEAPPMLARGAIPGAERGNLLGCD